MKKSIVFTICLFSLINIAAIANAAKEQSLIIQAVTASSYYSSNTIPSKAIDNRDNTLWMGQAGAGHWWITFDFGYVTFVDYIKFTWSGNSSYVPKTYDIQYSTDNINWRNVYATPLASKTYETKGIGRNARYIRLYMSAGSCSYPGLAEFNAFIYRSIPGIISFKGNLKDSSGIPINGTKTITFKIYETKTGGTALWEETQNTVTIEDGIFTAELGSINSVNLQFDKQYYVGIKVESDNEMTPRFKLTTVPYAFRSKQ